MHWIQAIPLILNSSHPPSARIRYKAKSICAKRGARVAYNTPKPKAYQTVPRTVG